MEPKQNQYEQWTVKSRSSNQRKTRLESQKTLPSPNEPFRTKQITRVKTKSKNGAYQSYKTSKVEQEFPELGPYLKDLQKNFIKLDEKQYNQFTTKDVTLNDQNILSMRTTLVKWLQTVANMFKCHSETLQVSIQIIDYMLMINRNQLNNTNFQLLGITAFFIAAKLHEVVPIEMIPCLTVCDGLYSHNDLKKMQKWILQTLKFNFNFTTIQNYLSWFIQTQSSPLNFIQKVQQITQIALYDYELINWSRKLDVASCILYLASTKISASGDYKPYRLPSIVKFLGSNSQKTQACLRRVQDLLNAVSPQLNPEQDENLTSFSEIE